MTAAVTGRKPRSHCAQQGSSPSHESQDHGTATRTREIGTGVGDRGVDTALGFRGSDSGSTRDLPHQVSAIVRGNSRMARCCQQDAPDFRPRLRNVAGFSAPVARKSRSIS
jgi:hypothetical protein